MSFLSGNSGGRVEIDQASISGPTLGLSNAVQGGLDGEVRRDRKLILFFWRGWVDTPAESG